MPSPRPNILLLLTDQQRFDTIRALGSSFSARTPHLDRLAQTGVSFERAYCTAPVCSPSRATLMTGLYPGQAGMPGNLNSPCPPLSTSLSTVGKMMRDAGYDTAYHGKWHLGGDLHAHGFDVAGECSHDETTRLLASCFWKDHDWMTNTRPFFHVVSFLNPHDLYFYDPDERVGGFRRPWNNIPAAPDLPQSSRTRQVNWPEEKWGSYSEFYSRLLERVDADIGETLHQLRCSGYFSNTWIIFTSDHGDMAGEHDLPFKGPFGYEGVTRVPLIIVPPQSRFLGSSAPGTFAHEIPPGTRPHLCSLLDIVPTILDLAGAAVAPELSGRSLLPVLHNPQAAAPHDHVFASWHRPGLRLIRSVEWKYILHENGEEELYNLAEDPAETKNLASHPPAAATRATLAGRLQMHLEDTNDPFPRERGNGRPALNVAAGSCPGS
jgi:arylsulfatase A-like enzyme